MRSITFLRLFAAAAVVSFTTLPGLAQVSMPPGQATQFKDTSVLKPPAGDKVALIEFEDLECPACAAAAPIVRAAVEKYHIPYVHRDFPLGGAHIWSLDAAITARYLQDKVSPKTAEQFRLDTFAAQNSIASREDLSQYTRKWFAKHNLQMPFVIDPAGLFKQEVEADRTLGDRLGVMETPTIVVVDNRGWIQVKETTQLYAAIERIEADANSSPATGHSNVRKSNAPAK